MQILNSTHIHRSDIKHSVLEVLCQSLVSGNLFPELKTGLGENQDKTVVGPNHQQGETNTKTSTTGTLHVRTQTLQRKNKDK